ncbi:MAG TPA: gamma-glutamylcyclotransferase family protein [Candidatus Angelobacter sp.]|nr:gamma-glutamylcyclotransferase family protein [Candidatus Angelobacter sp.]
MNADKIRMFYFGYGSNMCTGRLRARVPSTIAIGKCFLRRNRFRLNKKSTDRFGDSAKGNIEETNIETDIVWGVLFEFDAAEKHLLDEAEALGHGYNETLVRIEFESGETQDDVSAYIADPEHIDNNLQPYSWYKRFITEGARQHDLPAAYIQFLENFPAQEDPDRGRDRKNRAIGC